MPRSRASRTPAAFVAVSATVVTLAGLTGCSKQSAPVSSFASSSPWRQLIPSDVELDRNSDAMIAAVQRERALNANLVEYAIPIYEVGPATPSYSVKCTEYTNSICPFAGWPVLVPDGAIPSTGTDGAMVTVDAASGTIFEFWRAVRKGEEWSASFGAVNSLRGSGWGGMSTGSGASRLGGVIRVSEIKAGVIMHAVALATDNACKTFRPPALKSDGDSVRDDCLPEGALLQLDPSLDLSKLNLTPGERAVAVALQRYGGYVMDVAGTSLCVIFERDASAGPGSIGETYTKAGFRWDYDAMEHVPWEKLRVLA
ncbi:hypothetical protein MycrhDRAFT_3156 [Mycolicibacterium rhodesiae JS60]|nr:hypothetical protein MycrhDRAFT_3156 [Mycolicibacterium rhodesiae JS60]